MKVAPPKRVSRTYTQSLVAPPEAVFPLLCPVREIDWIADWDPLLVLSNSGIAEEDCVFITRSEHENAVWYVTDYEPEKGFIAFVRVTPEVTATRLAIQVRSAPEGASADITFTHTSLGEKGDAFVDAFTEAAYAEFMRLWERRMNHYLTTGMCLAA